MAVKLEAQELVDQLQAKIQAHLDEAKELSAKEAALLAKADTAAATVATVKDLAGELEGALKELAPLAKALGEMSDLKLALAAVKDEAKTLIDAGMLSAQELRLEAQILWEDKPELVALRKAQAKLEKGRAEEEAKAFAEKLALAEQALAAIVEEQMDKLLERYPKRVADAHKGKFPVDADNKKGIREEILRAALRGKGISADIVEAVDLTAAEHAFGQAQYTGYLKRVEGKTDEEIETMMALREKDGRRGPPRGMSNGMRKTKKVKPGEVRDDAAIGMIADVSDYLSQLGFGREAIRVSVHQDGQGHRFVRGSVDGTGIDWPVGDYAERARSLVA